MRRLTTGVVAAAMTVMMVGGGGVAAGRASATPSQSHVRGATPAVNTTCAVAPPTSVPTSPPSGAFNVTASPYNADPTGATDSRAAIQSAINAAITASVATNPPTPETVYFPAQSGGAAATYSILSGGSSSKDGHYDDLVADATAYSQGAIVNFLGAGTGKVTVVDNQGIGNPNFTHNGGDTVFYLTGDNSFYFAGITINSQEYQAGDTIDNSGNCSLVDNDNFMGGSSPNNPDVFGMRDQVACLPTNGPTSANPTLYRYNNTVENVTVTGSGTAGNDDLDFSCEIGGTIQNITDTGYGTALYIDSNTTVDNYNYTPGSQSSPPGYYVTDSSNTLIDGFTSSGPGGMIFGGSITGGYQETTGTTIEDETMTGSGGSLVINDADSTTIESGSTIHNLQINTPSCGTSCPSGAGDNTVDVDTDAASNPSTVNAVSCQFGSAPITDLVGITCPVGTATATIAANATTATVALPPNVAQGDEIVLGVAVHNNLSVTASGLSNYATVVSGPGSSYGQLDEFLGAASSGETSVTVTLGTSSAAAIVAAVYLGVNTNSPVDTSSSGSAAPGTTVTAPSITPSERGEELVYLLGATGSPAAGTFSTTSPLTLENQPTGGPTNVDAALADDRLAGAAAVASQTGTFTQTAQLMGGLLLIKPATS